MSDFNPPPVFTEGTPSLEQVMAQTNRSLAVQALSSNSLTIKSPELSYPLSGHFRWERPDKIRLETKLVTSALGVPLAAGSNSDLFWLQMARPTPTIFYARHADFENQQGGRHVLPVSPLWLREAFGIIELDPQMVHEGPNAMPDGKLEVVSQIPTPRGVYRRTIVMSATTGTIVETRLADASGKLVAQARMLEHQYYGAINWSLPHQVQITLLPDVGDPVSFTVDVGYYQYNESSSAKAFEFPGTTGLVAVDLVTLNANYQNAASGISQSQTFQSQSSSNQNYLRQDSSSSVGPLNGQYQDGNLQWTVQPHGFNAPSASDSGQASAITPPVYRTDSASLQNWQGNLRR